MARRVSLVYYSIAILVGSLLIALAYYGQSLVRWGPGDRLLAGFLFVYALALAGGVPAQLANAFLLRRVTGAIHWHRPWHWLLLGTIIGWTVVWTLSQLGYLIERAYFPAELQRVKALLMFPFLGPIMFSAQPVSLVVAVAAATALVLRRVHMRGSR